MDLDPGAAGTVGQVIVFGRDDEEHRVLAPSLLSYLEQLGDLLEHGHGETTEGGDGWNLRGSNGYLDHTLFTPAGTAK